MGVAIPLHVHEGVDNRRWNGFGFRDGDIIISTRARCGTTWTQVICGMLIFGEPRLPGQLSSISPWLDDCIEPIGAVRARLEAQRHRRFIKTHTPLAALPRDSGSKYIVTARHPLDAAISHYHHYGNIQGLGYKRSLRDWLNAWIGGTSMGGGILSLPEFIDHINCAWFYRDEPDVLLLHYQEMQDDTEGQMRRIAAFLGIGVAEDKWPALVQAASFNAMRKHAQNYVPKGYRFRSAAKFFRAGLSGYASEVLDVHDLSRYRMIVSGLAPPEMLGWLHGGEL